MPLYRKSLQTVVIEGLPKPIQIYGIKSDVKHSFCMFSRCFFSVVHACYACLKANHFLKLNFIIEAIAKGTQFTKWMPFFQNTVVIA